MRYGLIGEKLGHSFSKVIHEELCSYTYDLIPMPKEVVGPFLESKEFAAINVTIPYKETVIPYLAHIDPAAQAIGAVNTIVNRGGELWGYNTDFAGMETLLRSNRIALSGRKVLILGSGGTCKTARAVAKDLGAKEILIASRHPSDGQISYEQALKLITNARRIILLGYAASAAVCYYAHFRFLELGLNCHFSSDAHINTAILAKPNPDDLFFCVSMSGETRDIVFPLHQARLSGAKVISLTGNANSTLASLSDVVIYTSTDETTFIADAMNARLAQMCTVDALFSMISIANESEAFSRLRLTRQAFHNLKTHKPE